MKFYKCGDGGNMPDSDRDVLVVMQDGTMGVGWWDRYVSTFQVCNVKLNSRGVGYLSFNSDIVAWAELPVVEY